MQDLSGAWTKLLEAFWNTQVTLHFLDHGAALKDDASDMMKAKVCQWSKHSTGIELIVMCRMCVTVDGIWIGEWIY
jgi:hypothetical protein